MSTPSPNGCSPLTSTLAGDADFAELIVMFVDDLQGQLESLAQAVAAVDLDAVHRLAHTIKGSAGGYGFDPVTDAAKKLDDLAKAGADTNQVQSAFAELRDLCARIRV